ncbi:hypothetical protein L209DRAFT_404000 [Thermothelomyces heterothallicus CBS 203.75]
MGNERDQTGKILKPSTGWRKQRMQPSRIEFYPGLSYFIFYSILFYFFIYFFCIVNPLSLAGRPRFFFACSFRSLHCFLFPLWRLQLEARAFWFAVRRDMLLECF